MKKILKIHLLFICLILAFSSCENTDKSEKQKLVDAFEQYVNGLSPEEMRTFDMYKKGGNESVSGEPNDSSNIYYEFESGKFRLLEMPLGINMADLEDAKKGLEGRTIHMEKAIDFCDFEHDRRFTMRSDSINLLNKDSLERSVYFDYGNIETWFDDVRKKYPKTPPVGFRAYFAGYKNNLVVVNEQGKDEILNLKDKSTLVLRAMYLGEKNSKPTLLKIPWNPADSGSVKDILTFNLGGLCPPNCPDDPPIQ